MSSTLIAETEAGIGFAMALRKRRHESGMSQSELAAEAGVHPTYVSHLENGRKSPTLRTIAKLAHVMGLEWWQLTEMG